jgi:restriction endonuclease S subunit
LRDNNITEYGFDFSDIKFVDINFSKIPSKIIIKAGDLVLGRTGTIGLTHLVNERLDGAVMSQHITKIIVNEKLINKYYLIAYLNSKFARKQMEREALGSMQVELTLDATKKLLVLVPPPKEQEEIGDLIQKFYELNKQSESLYSQAENLFLEELGLKNFKVEDELSYIVNLSQVKSAHRADAEYFQPKYEKLIEHMKRNVEMQELKVIATTKRGSLIDPRFYNETEGFPYIRGKDFSSGRLEKSDLVYISRDFRPKNETKVNSEDLVFALIGTVGTSALVEEEFDNSFISNNVGKISIKNKKEILPEYLAIVLNSIVGKLQFEKEASQTAQPKISDFQVRNFKIPILPQLTQQKIADLVRQSHEARKKAEQLLEEAKRKTEELIEN